MIIFLLAYTSDLRDDKKKYFPHSIASSNILQLTESYYVKFFYTSLKSLATSFQNRQTL